MHYTRVILVCLLGTYDILLARESEDVDQVQVGNLAVSASQQPSPLVGFGQNIVNQGDLMVFLAPDSLLGRNRNFSEIIPSLLYGINDSTDLYLEFPIALKFKDGPDCSQGAQDFIAQIEYAFLSKRTPTATNQMTTVGAIFLPFGDDLASPATGFGSPSFFLGITASHLSTNWYVYNSYAALLTTPRDNDTKFGNEFFYQAGLGTNIAYSPDHWIFMWLVEFYGLYSQKDRVDGEIDPESGGNFIALVPSLFFSTQKFILQGGVGPVVQERFPGDATKSKVWIAFSAGYKF